MTLKEITEKKLANYNKIPEEFLSSIQRIEVQFYKELLLLVDEIERKDGVILLNAKNIATIIEIENRLKPLLLDTDYIDSVQNFINSIDEQAQLTNAYFKAAFPGTNIISEEANLVLQNQKRLVTIELVQDGIDGNFISAVRQQINAAVETKSTYRELLDSLQATVTGNNEVDSKLFTYSKQITHDAFAISDRAYTNAVSQKIKAEWFLYSGNERAATREFCLKRFGKYYHKKEIEKWGKGQNAGGVTGIKSDGDWNGKIDGTDESTIFINAGGWNCAHSILPVSQFVVPADVISRNIANGNIKG